MRRHMLRTIGVRHIAVAAIGAALITGCKGTSSNTNPGAASTDTSGGAMAPSATPATTPGAAPGAADTAMRGAGTEAPSPNAASGGMSSTDTTQHRSGKRHHADSAGGATRTP